MSDKPQTRVLTPVARLSFPCLFQKSAPMQGQTEGKYQCELIFEPGADLSAMKDAANNAAKVKWAGKPPQGVRSPFRDNSERNNPDNYPPGGVFLSCRSKDKPGVIVGPNKEECIDPSEVYGGCYVRVSISAFGYDVSGNSGVSFGLNNVWKVKEGEPFGPRRSAAQDFGGASSGVDAEAFGENPLL